MNLHVWNKSECLSGFVNISLEQIMISLTLAQSMPIHLNFNNIHINKDKIHKDTSFGC